MHQPRKRFGQHFLHDKNIIDKIVRAINPREEDHLLEIGPGQGALTLPLLEKTGNLTAIELDRDLIPILQEKSKGMGHLQLVNADVLKFELDSLGEGKRWRIAGNLPYNISTPLMFHLLDSILLIEDMHFMVQKEVAQRLAAGVGDRHYGRLSVMIQYYCECQYLFEVPPGCFTPPPRVDSAIIRMKALPAPAVEVGDFDHFSKIVRTAFGQRRKTIANSLKPLISSEVFEASGIDSRLRAENLGLPDFARLALSSLEHDISTNKNQPSY